MRKITDKTNYRPNTISRLPTLRPSKLNEYSSYLVADTNQNGSRLPVESSHGLVDATREVSGHGAHEDVRENHCTQEGSS